MPIACVADSYPVVTYVLDALNSEPDTPDPDDEDAWFVAFNVTVGGER